jgi:DNA helicase II / ATP-dependent DNA helicase PcrA
MTKIAIIGTAGRDKTKPMTRQLWDWMVMHATEIVPGGSHLVSGGAAWADHLAVHLFLNGCAESLTLHLPAPMNKHGFTGPFKSAASAANYYHGIFSDAIGENTIGQLLMACEGEHCNGTFEPEAPGYGAMFNRNKKVAATAESMLAYTFGPGDVPADGGTKDTWDMCRGERIHIQLPILE